MTEKFVEIVNEYNITITSEIQNIHDYILKNLSTYRYSHSISVWQISLRLGNPYNFETRRLYALSIAALAHDITKEKPPDFHMELFVKYDVKQYQDLPPSLYHSKSAVYFLKEKFNIENTMVAHAISHHSTGCEEMPLVSRILYCADFLASNLSGSSHDLDEKLNKSLNHLCLEKAGSTMVHLIRKNLPVQPESLNFYNILLREREREV